MSHGPGKYDPQCTQARMACDAQGCVLIVYGGKHGEGFSVQGPLEMLQALPLVLRTMASHVEEDLRAKGMA